MKNIIMGFTITLAILFIGGLCLITITNNNIREQELRESLNMAIEDTLSDCLINKSYSIETKNELMADFCTKLMLEINQNCDLKIKLVGADMENGILYIQVTSYYRHVNGKDGEITCTKAVVLNEKDS